MSPANTPPRRPLPHLMSTSHNGVFGIRMTNENGQNIDIYENPSEHYAGFNNGPSQRTPGSHSPFLAAFRKNHGDADQHSSHGFGKNIKSLDDLLFFLLNRCTIIRQRGCWGSIELPDYFFE